MASRIVHDNSAAVLRFVQQKTDEFLRGLAQDMTRYAKEAPTPPRQRRRNNGKYAKGYEKGSAYTGGGAPRDTGTLSRSINYRKMGRLWYRVLTNTHYGGYIELGTRKMKANAFLRRAWDKAAKGKWRR